MADFDKSLKIVEPKSEAVQTMIGREAQQIQGMVFMAKQYPRNEQQAYNKIMSACQRVSLAEDSMYEYPRGGTKVTGPSIRLAEAVAQNWGNIDFGIVELEQKDSESVVMSYAWDMETNTRQTKIFTVKHIRDTKKGSKKLDDSRDIYELTANQGARRLRACILGIIPGDVIDAAVEQCKETLKSGNKKPLAERIKDMIVAFEKDYKVDIAMLDKFIGCKSDAFSENDIIRLRNVYKSLKDGMAGVEDYFDLNAKVESEANKTTMNIDVKDADKATDKENPPPSEAKAADTASDGKDAAPTGETASRERKF